MAYTLILNGTLIDGNGGAPLPDAAVLVKDNRIQAAGRKNEVALPDAGLTTIDARGGFILPGLIDTHVHVMLEGYDPLRMMTTPFSLKFYQSANRLRRTVEAGITSARDAGGADLGVKQAVCSVQQTIRSLPNLRRKNWKRWCRRRLTAGASR